MTDTPLHYQTLAQLRVALDAGELSAEELTRALVERTEQLDGSLNAYRLGCPERALEQARVADRRLGSGTNKSPLCGLPYAAKDLFDVKGMPTSAGCHLLETTTADKSASVIEKLDAAGMVMLGKTNTVQFAYGGAGINHDHGTPHNPWHERHHVPGGSSSGSGVAVAAGMTPMALGTDTGGSVRIPAALCGIAGLKTTVGQVSRAGVYPLSWTLDSVGPLARSVQDLAWVYECLQGPDSADSTTAGRAIHPVCDTLMEGVKGLRLSFPTRGFWDGVDSEVEQYVRNTQIVFESLGARFQTFDFEEAEQARDLNSRGLIAAAEAWTCNRHLLETNFDELDPIVAFRMIKGRDIPADEYLHICVEMLRLRAAAAAALDQVDALLVPTTTIPPRPVDVLDGTPEAYAEANLAYLRNTAIGNVLNLCSVSVPCGFTTQGLPIGLMIYAKPYREDMALRVAQAFEQATDWHLQHPGLEWLN